MDTSDVAAMQHLINESPAAPTGPGLLPDPDQILRLGRFSLALRCSMAEALDVWAWLHGWQEYGPGSRLEPEVITARLAGLSDVELLAARGRSILDSARIKAVLHTHDQTAPPT